MHNFAVFKPNDIQSSQDVILHVFNVLISMFVIEIFETLNQTTEDSAAYFCIRSSIQLYIYLFSSCITLLNRKPLIPCVEKQLLGQHLSSILQKGACLFKVAYTLFNAPPPPPKKKTTTTTTAARNRTKLPNNDSLKIESESGDIKVKLVQKFLT